MKFVDASVISQDDAAEHIKTAGEDAKTGWESSKVEAALPTAPEVVFWNVTE
jgi:hypothetical protein